MGGRLTGCRILVVEDDPLIAMGLEDTLSMAGAEIIGPAHNVARALHFITRAPLTPLCWITVSRTRHQH